MTPEEQKRRRMEDISRDIDLRHMRARVQGLAAVRRATDGNELTNTDIEEAVARRWFPAMGDRPTGIELFPSPLAEEDFAAPFLPPKTRLKRFWAFIRSWGPL